MGINPIRLSDPWDDSIDVIALKPVTKIPRINSMVLSDPWVDSIVNIALQQVKQFLGINVMGLSAYWADSLDNIALDPVKNNCQGLTQWALVPLGPTPLLLLPCGQ